MENPGTARNNKKEEFEIKCIVAAARDLMEEIEARDSGSKDNDLGGPTIEGNVSLNKCFYDEETKKGYREDENGKREGNPKIMRQAYEARKKREKEDRGRE